ncbi:MAG: ACT domain-containing protein [Candidatus Solibacter usitatus]|nr:ACT domain-containing protein [Candidatus Solibacter usitatus]
MTICRLGADAEAPPWAMQGRFWCVTRTADELSVVCEEEAAPAGVSQECGWGILKVHGPLDFALTGVLSNLTSILAAVGIAVFALSTFDTDYLLVKHEKMDTAVAALRDGGHTFA